MALRRNILANLLGNGWIALLTLAATPVQVHLLGVEAYGLIGLITVLQIIFGTLDLGLSASVTQTIASDRSVGRQQSAPLTNSAGSIYAIAALLIGALLWWTAEWIATQWLQPQKLGQDTVLTAVRAIGLYVAFRWPIAFYSGVLTGVQRMDALNLLKGIAATARIVGGIVLILWRPSIVVFLEWFAASALLELLAFAITTHRLVPELRPSIRISLAAIRSVWRFSAAMATTALLSMVVTQLDRVFVSKLLSLEELGYYTLAYTAAIGISLLQVSINSATLPAFAEAASQGREDLARRYTKMSELTSFAVGLPCFLVAFFANEILRIWIGEDAAKNAGMPLTLLAVGFFLNAAVSNAYLSTVATRQAQIPAAVNAVGTLLYAPVLFALTISFGPVGAAASWVALNLYYCLSLVPAAHRRVLGLPILPWSWQALGAPMLTAMIAIGVMKATAILIGGTVATLASLLLAVPLYLVVSYRLGSTSLREIICRARLLPLLPRRIPN